MAPEVRQKDVARVYKAVLPLLEQPVALVHESEYMRRFCSRLGMNHADMRAAEAIAEAACPRDGRSVAPCYIPSESFVRSPVFCSLLKMLFKPARELGT